LLLGRLHLGALPPFEGGAEKTWADESG